jgi:hypothetical protein
MPQRRSASTRSIGWMITDRVHESVNRTDTAMQGHERLSGRTAAPGTHVRTEGPTDDKIGGLLSTF